MPRELLSGAVVLDLTQMLSGPYASLLLADLGARVIKIEDPGTGDRIRGMGPHFNQGESAYFLAVNRNKESVCLDLRKEKDREIFYRLVEKADVVLDNFRPRVLQKLGLEYEILKKRNPKIIHLSLSAFGQDGPYRESPAFDLTLQALSGAMSVTGEPGGDPVRLGLPMGDLAGGTFAALAVAAALFHREKTGEGCRIDISLLDSMVSLLTYMAGYYWHSGDIPGPIGSGHQTVVPYQAFRTKTFHIVIAVFVEKFWRALCEVLGIPEIADDPRFNSNLNRLQNKDILIPVLQERFLTRSGEDWLQKLTAAEVPCAPVNTLDRVLNDPQVLYRGMVAEVDHPKCGRLKVLGNPFIVRGVKRTYKPAPLLGEHTRSVLAELLGDECVSED
jgi:crotonobetainyl-CoA:carnitine CoA-transferase CaiB-like acyl-CoA transferase